MSFGPFRLFPAARVLERDGVPLALGSRSLDILIALVERAGEVVSQRELLSRVWRDLVVDSSNLRVQVTHLRKALGDGGDSGRYIANVPGQGYSFVAPITRSAPERAVELRALPPVLARMIGRTGAVRAIAAELTAHRFLTIVGPGGIGKTTVALSIAHALRSQFADDVRFVDLGAVTDPALVAEAVATALGPDLRTRRMLVVLDNCEHVIESISVLAEQIFCEAPFAHVLATSREALRVEGEHVYPLPPLESPHPDAAISAAEALAFPAIELFVERARAGDRSFELRDLDVPLVAGICRRLDGIPLAIEIAAGRVGTYGIQEVAALLGKRFGMRWQGRRTAPPRQQTLHALLEWSHNLLAEPERRVLRRLSVFPGSFTLDASHAVACENALDGLVMKSLASALPAKDGVIQYRLLETARLYALEKLEASGEAEAVSRRHAAWLAQA